MDIDISPRVLALAACPPSALVLEVAGLKQPSFPMRRGGDVQCSQYGVFCGAYQENARYF
jgi:hypothetical protein